MFFNKKEPIDIRDLPRNKSMGKSFVAKDGYGFVDLTQKRKLPSEIAKEKALAKTINPLSSNNAPSSSFSFFAGVSPDGQNTPSNSTPSYSSSTSSNNSDMEELMRKISTQISDLDTKIYKMEQRIELLERKAGINNSSNSGFGW
jgi:hypothetical protein